MLLIAVELSFGRTGRLTAMQLTPRFAPHCRTTASVPRSVPDLAKWRIAQKSWRTVDQEGEILESFVTTKRDMEAAGRLQRNSLR